MDVERRVISPETALLNQNELSSVTDVRNLGILRVIAHKKIPEDTRREIAALHAMVAVNGGTCNGSVRTAVPEDSVTVEAIKRAIDAGSMGTWQENVKSKKMSATTVVVQVISRGIAQKV